MNAQEILSEAARVGVRIRLRADGRIVASPSGRLPPEVRAAVPAAAPDLLAILGGSSPREATEPSESAACHLQRFTDAPYAGFFATAGTRDPRIGEALAVEAQRYREARSTWLRRIMGPGT